MRRTLVRYRVKPDRVGENEALVRAVSDELASSAPDGFHYATFKLDDGVSFVHIAAHEGDGTPLTSLAAFAAFQAGLRDRCDELPVVSPAERIGSFRLGPAG